MSHTPGPWEVAYEDDIAQVQTVDQFIERIADGSRPKKNAKPYHYPICQFGYFFQKWSTIKNKETRDNARLIAAAPALLAACQEWIECWNSSRDMDRIVKSCELIEKTEAAIAAALPAPAKGGE